MDDPIEKAGMVSLFARWIRAYDEYAAFRKISNDANTAMAEQLTIIKHCKSGFLAFGYDVSDQKVLEQVRERFGELAQEAVERTQSTQMELGVDNLAAPTDELNTPRMPAIKSLVLEQLKLAGKAGSKAAPIREFIERTYNVRIHEKTVGMTLYRLSQEELVRRDGHTWFIVPQVAETMNPGAVTPGSEAES